MPFFPTAQLVVRPPETATERDDPRIAATQTGLDMFEQMAPAMKTMHHDTATDTAEAIDLLGMSFRTHHFAGMADVARYDRWWLGCDMVPAYRFHREVLQLLQWRCPPRRWHLKNPPDLFCLDAVAASYPDVRFIWTHRSPAEVLPSVASLIATVQSMATDTVDTRRIGAHQLDLWATAVERGLAWRLTQPDLFVDVYMRDLVADPDPRLVRWTVGREADDTDRIHGVRGVHAEPGPRRPLGAAELQEIVQNRW